MFRRSRLAIRPNVGTAGRTAGSPQETSSNKNQDNVNTRVEIPVSVTDNDTSTDQTPCIDQNGEAAGSSAIQRRKRFSVRPKVVPGRPSALPRTPKSPVKPVLPTVKSPAAVVDKAETLIEATCTAPHQELLTPKECQPSDESRFSKTDAVSPSEDSSKCIDQPSKIQSSSCSQVKEISPKAPVPPSIPDREATDISEKAKTLVSKTELTTSSQHFSLTQLLNDKSDLLRLEKARKLRHLLKQEMLKEKSKKYMARVKEYSLDPSKMTMRDLIHYLPASNPMSSTLEEAAQENETAIPQSPAKDISPERAQEQEVQPNMLSSCHGEATATTSAEGEQEHEEEEAEEAAEDEEALMVPQVKVAEDGSLIIDEESLTVEVQRMKGPNPIQDRDPIFERGSTTTYSSFRKGTHTKPWSTEETDMFFLAISMVGTDFAMISQLFPHRARSEIKNKFKKEERYNAWRIDKAFRERQKLDLEYFTKLLEKILEFQQSKKKLKSISEKPKTSKRKAKGKKVMAVLSDVEEENEHGVSIEEQEGEKENLCNEKISSSKTKCKRKHKDDLSPEPPVANKKKKREKKKLSDDASALADLEEVAIPEDHLRLDQSKKTKTQAAKTAEAKTGKPQKKTQKSKAISDTEEETTSEDKEGQTKKDSFSSQQSAKRMSDNESSDHEITVQPARPSRYGRISKPVQPLNYPAKDTKSSASDSLASPAHQTADAVKAINKTHGKRGRVAQKNLAKESKKPTLITLRASQSEGSDDDDEETHALHYDENSTSAFVPASLCSPKPVVPEVEETMEEFDMLAHMPDVLGISKNALCPDASCEQVQNERGTVEPCEHQLDLLVDVIDFLSEHTEASEDESYNEAAQTLLAIGNPANLAQPTESQPLLSDHISKFEGSHCSEVDDFSKSSFEQEECTALVSETSKTENKPTDSPMELPPASFTFDTQVFTPSGELSNTEETDSSTHISTPRANNFLPPRKGRLSKIKPKPNVGSATRTTKLLTQTVGAVMESHQVEIAATCQHQSLRQLGESTLAVSDSRPADSTTVVMPTSHVSNAQVSYEPRCKQDTIDSPQLQTPEPKINSAPPMRHRLSKIKPNISCALRTTKQTAEAGEDITQVESDMTSTSQPGSSEHQEESTQAVSEQDESTSTQGTATTQLETLCAKNSSAPRKGRLSKLKLKPNIESASRITKQSSQSVDTTDKKQQTVGETATANQMQSVALPLSKSVVGSCGDFHQESLTFNSKGTEADQSNRFTLSHSEISGPQGQGEEACTLEEHLDQFTVMNCTPPVQCAAEALEQSRPIENITSLEPEIITSTQCDHSSAEEKMKNIGPVQLSDPSSESLKHSTPQRRRWVPKVKPKPNLVSPRAAKSRLEFKQKSQATDQLVKSSSLNATSEQPMLQDSTTAKPHDHVQSVNVEANSASSVQSVFGILLGAIDKTQLAASSVNTNITKFTSSFVPGSNNRSTEKMTNMSKTDKIYEDPTIVQQHGELSTANQTNVDHCSLIECVPSVPSDSSKSSKTVHQLQEFSVKNTETCVISKASSLHVETTEIPTVHIRPTEGAVEPPTELQHNDAAPSLGLNQMQGTSVQNSFEYKRLLFPNIPPDQVPSDPDEPFFILSLTEIPVCPSGEEVDPRPESYHAVPDTEAQQSNPVEPVVPLAAGFDDSLSNIHIPTPEKATLKSGLICVEEYLTSAPSVDISLLEEPQENPSMRRLPEAESNIEHHDTLSADEQPSVGSDVKKSNERQSLKRKTAAKKTNRHGNVAQDLPESFIQIESCEVLDSDAQKGSDGSSVIGKMKKTAETRGNKSQTKKSKTSGEPLWGWSEMQFSEASTGNVACSKDSQPTSSSELLDPNQSDSSNVLDEGPTNVSEYFFCDVFTEVESDGSVTGNITGDAACRDKTQSPLSETKMNLRQHSNSPCGQKSPITAPQKPEATADKAISSNLPGSSATEATFHSSQQEHKKSRGRGKGNANSDAKGENSRLQRRSTAANFRDAVSQDSLNESTSSTPAVPPQTHETNQLSCLQSTSKILDSHQSVSIEGSFLEEEPTNVVQYFFSDVFTEVESNDLSVTGKSNSNSSCSGTTSSQKAEMEINGRQKRRKAYSDPPSGQHSSLTEGQPPDAASKNTQSSIDVTTTDSSQRYTKKTRGKGGSKKKSKTLCESLRALRKSTEASEPPEAVLQDSLNETQSTSSVVRPQNQRGSLSESTEVPVHKNYSAMEVEVGSGSSSVKKSKNEDSACGDKTETQTSETRGNTRTKRKTKASSGCPLIQELAHEASGTHEAQKTVDSSQLNTEKTRGIGSFKRKNKASDEATAKRSQPRGQDTAESKSPARIKEALSASSSMEQLELQATSQGDSKESGLFDDEPTTVSQYFLSDIFTDVDEEFKS